MSAINHNSDQTNGHKTRLYLASLLLIIGTLMPTIDFKQDNIIWFWQLLTYPAGRGHLTGIFLTICGFLTIFIPLLLCRYLPSRLLAVNILFFMLLSGIMATMPFLEQAVLLGIPLAAANSYAPSLLLVSFYSLIILGVASRLTISLPLHNYPLLMLRIASILLLLLVGIVIYSKLGTNSNAYNQINTFIFPDLWMKDPIIMIFAMAFTLLFIFSLMSSYKKTSGDKIAIMIYALTALAGIIFLQTKSGSFSSQNYFFFIATVKILVLGFAYISLLSSSLYASCYLFREKT